MKKKKHIRYWKLLMIILFFIVIIPLTGRLFLPDPLFHAPYSTVLFDRHGNLLGARIAKDGQWRFPETDSLPSKYITAVLQFEDRHFYQHFGFNPVSAAEALIADIKAGKIVRGGSTITMQVIRMSRHGKPRTITEKLWEIYLAIALETKYSKKEILNLYASHAPFGGNVTGLDAAVWRYFGHNRFELTWAEAALLAVLPNAPSLIRPGKNSHLLLQKRNRLLKSLFRNKKIDSITYRLALREKIPDKPHPLPDEAPHLLEYFRRQHDGTKIYSTLDAHLQHEINRIVSQYQKKFSQNEIYNLAVLVIRPSAKEVLAYVGNAPGKSHGEDNDMIRARRSTGSILKPFLYAAAINDGQILLNSLIPDIPSYFKNYHPQNYDRVFEGAVPASQALSRSRNVPAIYLLRDYGIGRFMDLMKQMGITTFNQPADHYGLSLILGGGEATLWQLTSAYAGMAQTVLNYDRFYGKYTGQEYAPPVLLMHKVKNPKEPAVSASVPLHAGAIWETYQAMYQVHRPHSEEGWEYFNTTAPVAWKTGTSFGFKDAWAIGSTPDYIVGVWVGNADGEGREGLTGTDYAAPVLFDVFHLLKPQKIFPRPEDEMTRIVVCRKSGYQASRFCPETDTILTYKAGTRVKICPYHHLIFTDKNEKYRLSGRCASVQQMKKVSWFILPPVEEWYYHQTHPGYKMLPPYKPGCAPPDARHVIAFIYPHPGTRIFIPRGINGEKKKIVFEVSLQNPHTTLYWNMDNLYLGATHNVHRFAFIPSPGRHQLTVTDQNGNSRSIWFTVVDK
ncbi:penicillin-binding protein 1C [Candidatus Sulfidibacterium hydrothermale]|uniref:penicillin-binding protein 1C n=1 Tax=Candidatus Sulfidibacterium hydrothermale TaxID=2875962 RepID=UPI001F0AEAE7|nr:penicillin-binding protein 1C [Candidatus Sulfidibacterium hydrothermale]UBM62386.1 penicillin-binding protein 1C [Candidatus Sulfidibacterium hydrothermale]